MSAKKTARQDLSGPVGSVATPKQTSLQPKSGRSKTIKETVSSCFILMPFKEPFETYYNTIIKPAVLTANLDALRGDSLFTPTPIMGDVWQMIQDAHVLVAELTGKNPNVFYELGLGHAIGKPIVLISETMDDVPFDLQQLRVILYDKNDPAWGNKLKNNIVAALAETMSEPVNAVPPMFRKKVKSQAPSDSELKVKLEMLEQQVRGLLRTQESWRWAPAPMGIQSYRQKLTDRRITVMQIHNLTTDALRSGLDPKLVSEELRKLFDDEHNASEFMRLAREEIGMP